MFIVATNVIASWPPERWPTGMPTAHAKIKSETNTDIINTSNLERYYWYNTNTW